MILPRSPFAHHAHPYSYRVCFLLWCPPHHPFSLCQEDCSNSCALQVPYVCQDLWLHRAHDLAPSSEDCVFFGRLKQRRDISVFFLRSDSQHHWILIKQGWWQPCWCFPKLAESFGFIPVSNDFVSFLGIRTGCDLKSDSKEERKKGGKYSIWSKRTWGKEGRLGLALNLALPLAHCGTLARLLQFLEPQFTHLAGLCVD